MPYSAVLRGFAIMTRILRASTSVPFVETDNARDCTLALTEETRLSPLTSPDVLCFCIFTRGKGKDYGGAVRGLFTFVRLLTEWQVSFVLLLADLAAKNRDYYLLRCLLHIRKALSKWPDGRTCSLTAT